MKTRKPIGLNEIMIVNPSTKQGARTMFFYPVGQGPDEPGPYGQMPNGQAIEYYGQPPEEEMGYYGQDQYPDQAEMGYYGQYYEPAEMGYYGQVPEEDMSYYGQSPDETEMAYYGQYPPEEIGYYGQPPEEDLGCCGQQPAAAMGYYGQVPEEEMGYSEPYPGEGVEGYVREQPPAFNPRGVFIDQLGGFVRERPVDPACYLTRPARVKMPASVPSMFKPHF